MPVSSERHQEQTLPVCAALHLTRLRPIGSRMRHSHAGNAPMHIRTGPGNKLFWRKRAEMQAHRPTKSNNQPAIWEGQPNTVPPPA